jgi:hypothetical protein
MLNLLSEQDAINLRKATMIHYLQMKVNEQDWHGVADAAMDLRELEVELKMCDKIDKLRATYHQLGIASNIGTIDLLANKKE